MDASRETHVKGDAKGEEGPRAPKGARGPVFIEP